MSRRRRSRTSNAQPELFLPVERDLLVSRRSFSGALARLDSIQDHNELRVGVTELKALLASPARSNEFHAARPDDSILFRRDVLLAEFDQILASQTAERARYYLKRLRRALDDAKTTGINDINLRRWKEYDDILTDSLWSLPKRDTSGAHLGWYWGNFVPQIPHQLILRFTRKGDWVLDPFVGSGTTLIECRRLGRNGVGVDLNADVIERARELVDGESNKDSVKTELLAADSRIVNYEEILA
ncbi:MAG TPA: DNA methyltransferase, partial [Blastocatellia bacterium]|nr:DNA methyltransferase [Blastocatellia bacterium]